MAGRQQQGLQILSTEVKSRIRSLATEWGQEEAARARRIRQSRRSSPVANHGNPRPEILAPIDLIYAKLREAGVICSLSRKTPSPIPSFAGEYHPDIIRWYDGVGRGLLHFYRVCDNLGRVKAIVDYHVRRSAILTLSHKYECPAREIVGRFGRDLECLDEQDGGISLMSRVELDAFGRKVNPKVKISDEFKFLDHKLIRSYK